MAEAAIAQHKTTYEQAQEQTAAELAKLTETNEELRTRADTQRQEIDQLQLRLDQAVNQNAEAFQQAEKTRDADFRRAEEARAVEVSKQLELTSTAADETLADLTDKAGKAGVLLAAMGKEATSGHFGTYAKTQRNAARAWNVGVILALVVSAAAVGLSVLGKDDLDWDEHLRNFALGAVFLTIAGYCGSQASGHRKQERKMKRFELGLTALEPYLAQDPSEASMELRRRIAERVFVEEEDEKATGLDREAIPSAAAFVADLLAELAGKAKSSPSKE